METTDPWTSSYTYWNRVYSLTTYYLSDVQVSDVPYDPPVDVGYYNIRIKVVKNSTTTRDNSSTASPSYIDDDNIRFIADNIIKVSF